MEVWKQDLQRLNDLLIKGIAHCEQAARQTEISMLSSECIALEQTAESIALTARLLPMKSGCLPVRTALSRSLCVQTQSCCCFLENGWFYLRLPVLLNRKEKAGGSAYIRDCAAAALQSYFQDYPARVLSKKQVIIFKHNYSAKRRYRDWRDHDNIEVNSVTDELTTWILEDDGPGFLSHYHFSQQAQRDSTEIFLVEQGEFISFLQAVENDPDQWLRLDLEKERKSHVFCDMADKDNEQKKCDSQS